MIPDFWTVFGNISSVLDESKRLSCSLTSKIQFISVIIDDSNTSVWKLRIWFRIFELY